MKETDLDKVKAMAKVFLEIEIGETEMSPAIVQHPFANSGFYPCRSDDGTRITIIRKRTWKRFLYMHWKAEGELKNN